MSGPLTRTTVVVVTWRGREHLTAALDALAAQTSPHRTVVVDNASADGSSELLATHPSRPDVLRLPRNRGYAGGLAAALPAVTTEFVAWLNDDAVPAPDWLTLLEKALDADETAAAASARLESAAGKPISVGVGLTADGHGYDLVDRAEVFGFCGGAALLRTSALRSAGGVPAGFFCYYEDTDTAWRLRLAGRTVVSVPAARVVHKHGASSRPGSRRFHLWNERNRLAMLVRCAPGEVVVRELIRFTAITVLLPVRRLAGRNVPAEENFRLPLRARVLAELLVRLVPLLRQRRAVTKISQVSRREVWLTAHYMV